MTLQAYKDFWESYRIDFPWQLCNYLQWIVMADDDGCINEQKDVDDRYNVLAWTAKKVIIWLSQYQSSNPDKYL